VTPEELDAALRSLAVDEDLAQRHLARLGANWATHGDVVPLRRRRTTARATAAGLVLGATLASGAGVAAASTSLPGDPLYGLKTARERLQLTMARPGNSRARLELTLARTRLAEAARLFATGHEHRAVETLARADAALASARAQGGDAVDSDVDGELDRRVEVLGGLLDGGLPEPASDAAREAIDRAIDRGAKPASHPTPPANPRHDNGAHPTPAPRATPDHPTPSTHPGKNDHPTGRPTAVPSRRP
jgi:hypothetical protein